jgi:glycosyltransferase involved in cell wall biosynthesis
MYVADIWPDIGIRMGRVKPGLAMSAMRWLERFGYRKSDAVALTTPGARRQISERFPEIRTAVLSNGVDTNMFRPDLRNEAVRRRFGVSPDDFLVGYIGLHGFFQGLTVVIDAAEKLRSIRRVKFLMIGDGVEKDQLIGDAKKRGLTNVTFVDPMPKKEIPPILASCDASVIPLAVALPGTMPSKIYEAMAAGVPVLVVKQCEGELLVDEENAGRTFEVMDGAKLAAAIEELSSGFVDLDTIKKNSRRVAMRYDRALLADHLENVLEAINGDRPLPEMDDCGRADG